MRAMHTGQGSNCTLHTASCKAGQYRRESKLKRERNQRSLPTKILFGSIAMHEYRWWTDGVGSLHDVRRGDTVAYRSPRGRSIWHSLYQWRHHVLSACFYFWKVDDWRLFQVSTFNFQLDEWRQARRECNISCFIHTVYIIHNHTTSLSKEKKRVTLHFFWFVESISIFWDEGGFFQ